jgi:hypothetical protein
MKSYSAIVVALFFSFFAKAQSATEEFTEFNKSKQPAAVFELPYSPDVVEGAIKDSLQKRGARPERVKDYYLFKNIRLNDDDTSAGDYYVSVERKSRRESNISVIRIFAALVNVNPKAKVPDDRFGIDNAKKFLDAVAPRVQRYDLELKIAGQEEEVKKAEKKYKGLVEEGEDLVKKKKNIEEKIDDNLKEQEKQRKAIENLRTVLEALKAKRS